jgi:pSer/pThr/pTyr-binding forkhead associated (FHA) protein
MEAEHLDVSRRHCLVEIAPASVSIRDLGSLNGTFVNGRKIGQRTAWDNPKTDETHLPSLELTDGDEIRLGEHTAFRVCLFSPDQQGDTTKKRRRSSGELQIELPVPS